MLGKKILNKRNGISFAPGTKAKGEIYAICEVIKTDHPRKTENSVFQFHLLRTAFAPQCVCAQTTELFLERMLDVLYPWESMAFQQVKGA